MAKEFFAARDSVELRRLNIENVYRVNYVFIEKERVIRIYFYNWSHQQEARKVMLDFIKSKMKQIFKFKIKAGPEFLKFKSESVLDELKL